MFPQTISINLGEFLSIHTGLQPGFATKLKIDSTTLSGDNISLENLAKNIKKVNLSVVAGAELSPIKGLFIGARYNHPLGNFLKNDADKGLVFAPDKNLKNNLIQIYAGIRFSLDGYRSVSYTHLFSSIIAPDKLFSLAALKFEMKKFFEWIISLTGIAVSILLAASWVSGFINPVKNWFVSILALTFPYVFLLAIPVAFLGLTIKNIKFWILIILLVLTSGTFRKSFFNQSLKPSYSSAHALSLITHNIGSSLEGNQRIKWSFYKNTDADILCFQEWYEPTNARPIKDSIMQHYKSTLKQNPNPWPIFSRYPILNQGEIRSKAIGNGVTWADILYQKDTIRIYNVHLVSNRISNQTEALMNGDNPVSYTHLDVYKRQAKSLTEDVIDGFNAGGNDYLRKPFSMEELMVRIKNLLQLTNKSISIDSNQEETTIGKYVFYSGRQELLLDGKTKRLSHRETELLSMLVDKKNDTVIRKQILDKIWGNDSQFNSRNLDVYITKLRDYLKEDEKIQIITLKGVGYRLVD